MAKTKDTEKERPKFPIFLNSSAGKIELVDSKGESIIIKAGESMTIKDQSLIMEAQRNPKLIMTW